ncbi:C-type mannose receptor 2 [Oreochromis niloticus]|uniref:C-type mannose receptor 2 n=1 Tax=Oreochromis niloticus TaxID=8128 RepID=UPI00022AF5D9|nr:C-type mannose receptor 2 [Oreochromis niloticus]CAI5659096.1 unnamed protein product [Mustela putorius furo]
MVLAVILLLVSGYVTLCSPAHREFYLINENKIWDDAQSYCRSKYTDLATIGSQDDMQRLVNMVSASGVTAEMWIGLTETGPASWLWSVGETQISDGVVEYTNWASLPSSTDNCGGMSYDGKWFSAPCTTTLPYVCQDIGSSGFYVVFQGTSWIYAQQDCRMNNKDLASARSQMENLVLQQIINGAALSSVWIGLFRDDWKWSDQSNSSFRYWATGQPNNDGACTLYSPSLTGFMDRGCTYSIPFICYEGSANQETKHTRTVKVEFKSSLNLNDFNVSDAILQQIQSKYQNAKVRWRVQPDGKIFHKEEEKEIKDAC